MLPTYNLYWPSNTRLSDLGDHLVDFSWSKSNWVLLLPGIQRSFDGFQFSDNKVSLFNINDPWNMINIEMECGNINYILWNPSGDSFVTVSSKNVLTFWESKENLINKWEKVNVINICENDDVVYINWIDDDAVSIDCENAFKTNDYLQRYAVAKNKLFANTTSSKGLVCVTASGFLKVILFDEENEPSQKMIETHLGSMSINIERLDMCVNENNKLFIAAQTGESVIELFTVAFKESRNTFTPNVEVWPCIVPHMDQISTHSFRIKDVKVISFNSVDYTIVNSTGNGLNLLQIFEIKKELVVLHHTFPRQQQNQPQSADTAVCLKKFQFSNEIISMSISSINYTNFSLSGNHLFAPKLYVIDSMNSLYIISLLDFSQIAKVDCLNFAGELLACKLSSSEQSMLIITNENIAMFSLPHFIQSHDPTSILPVLLGYSLNSNIVPWDVLSIISTLDIHQIDNLCQIFIQEFNEQSQSLQQLLFKSYIQIHLFFYQLLNNGSGILCSNNLLLLRQIYSYFLSVVSTESDIKILDTLKKVCASKKDVDIGKLIQHLDLKDSILASFIDPIHRPLIQWLTDFSIFIIRNILSTHHNGQNWKNILKYFDVTSILNLRELLLLFYTLYQKNPTHVCPIFVSLASPNDMIVRLFKFLTKFHLMLCGESSDININELPLSNLPLMYLEVSHHRQQTALSMNNKNILNEYEILTKDENWNYVQHLAVRNPLSSGISTINTSPRQFFDGINLTYVSLMSDEEIKKCCSCNTLTIHTPNHTRSFNTHWKDSFKIHCFCGGVWRKISWNT